MTQNYLTQRHRFFSDQALVVESPSDPPTPRIQNIRLFDHEAMEEISLGASEEFASPACKDFSINFSNSSIEHLLTPSGRRNVQEDTPAERMSSVPLLAKGRSRSDSKIVANRSIYSYLVANKISY
jgi:hypothetical protein